jgi:8-oxo-dGTP diphosphatase
MAQKYAPPTLTVDSVVFQIIDDTLFVLLIKRVTAPFKDAWTLPGGYCAAGETTRQALSRILHTKASVDCKNLGLVEQLYTFDTVRDPHGHAVSVSYMGLGRNITPAISETTQTSRFFPVRDLPELAYDYVDIINYAYRRLESKLAYTNAVFALLPELFTLSQLQKAYEAILDRPLDRRNFRKKFLSLELTQETKQFDRQGAHRPARLHKFNKQTLETLARSFD